MAANKSPAGRRWCWLPGAVSAVLAGAAAPALSQVAQLEHLINQSDAIVNVEVAFVPYGDMVLVGDVVHGHMIELSSSNELLGDCLPRKAMVRELAANAAGSARASVYEESIERASYRAVVFLRHSGDASQVICDSGGHSTENWESDPHYDKWRARLDALLQGRR